MKATIWHNPKCGTSRKTLAILENLSHVELTVIEYLENPPSRDKLAQLYADAGMTPHEGLRLRGTDAEERGLPDAEADAVLDAMVADPILINRPLVETEKGVRLCRPQDVVLEILWLTSIAGQELVALQRTAADHEHSDAESHDDGEAEPVRMAVEPHPQCRGIDVAGTIDRCDLA